MQITIEIPDDIAQRLTQQVDNVPRRALESVVIEAYRAELITTAEVGRILQLESRWDVDAFLKQAGADLQYTEADLDQERETLRQLRTQFPNLQ
jgi:predicted HTH domain antitoxin